MKNTFRKHYCKLEGLDDNSENFLQTTISRLQPLACKIYCLVDELYLFLELHQPKMAQLQPQLIQYHQ